MHSVLHAFLAQTAPDGGGAALGLGAPIHDLFVDGVVRQLADRPDLLAVVDPVDAEIRGHLDREGGAVLPEQAALVVFTGALNLRVPGNRLTGMSSTVASYQFTLDGNGNRTASVETEPLSAMPSAASTTYGYNAAKNRLLSAAASNYGYDDEGQLVLAKSTVLTFGFIFMVALQLGSWILRRKP